MINLRHIRKRLIIFVILISLASAVGASALEVAKQLAPGVTLYQEINTSPGNELIINAITVDLSQNGVSVKSAIAGDAVSGTDASKGREAVSSMVLRKGALAGINADFFPFTGDPLGICISNGELISEPAGEIRAAMAIADNKIYFDNPSLSAKFTLSNQISRQIDGINRPRETNQAILYTESYGPYTYGKYKGVDVVMASSESARKGWQGNYSNCNGRIC